ncbi:MAG: hypothetical protein ACPG4W_06970 [Flavobacteriales bacterium]
MKSLLLLTTLALFASCDKDTDCFQGRDKGDGTVSFYVDGKLWQNSCEYNNKGSINGTANESMGAGFYDNKVHVAVTGKIWGQSTLYIGITTVSINEICSLGNGLPIYTGALDPFDHCKITLFYKDKEYVSKQGHGFIEIQKNEYDNINDIGHFEGIFEATLFNIEDSTDSISITDGFWNN